MGLNVGQMLRQAALRWPERVGVVELGPSGRAEHSFCALDAGARRVAAALRSHGVTPGDRVALMAANSADFVQAWFGCAYAGAAVVPVPVLSAAPELVFRLSHARCKVLLTDGARAELGLKAVDEVTPQTIQLQVEGLAARTKQSLELPHDTDPGDAAMVLYTSGTTGKPKGAVISHSSLSMHTAVLAQHALRLEADDRVLGVLPLTHSYGCRMVMLAAFFVGARCVLLPRFDAGQSLAWMQQEGVTWLPAVPTMFAAWGGLHAPTSPGQLRWALSAGAPLADETAVRAERALGTEVRQGFGMTEATFSTLNAPPDVRVLGSVGRAVWGVELRVVDGQGQALPVGEQGEVIVRGHNVMSHYLDDPEATLEARVDGWMRTGDVGRLDGQGRLTIVDRVKDMIIRGGNNVYPSEVEDALAAHPAVAEVAVVGRPDAYYGEEVVAVIVRRPDHALDAPSVIAFARERVARTKVPREVAFVERFPLGPSGKVLKRTLRQWLADGTLRALSGSA